MTPQQFIAKWGAPGGIEGPAFNLNEEQGAQSHFLDLCELLDVPKPGSAAGYRFEEKSAIVGGKTGYADVFMRGVFAWENKAPGKNLDAALKQLLSYSLALANPPILVVSDRLTIRIHTQFTGHPSELHEVRIGQMDQPDKLALLRRIWTAPDSFKPRETSRDITEAAARSFATLAEGLRQRTATPTDDADTHQRRANQVAHFLTQCLFCFFAEDVGLLPGRMFERLVGNRQITPERLTLGLTQLFATMGDGGLYGVDDIPWFNGGLFKTIDVPALAAPDLAELRNAAALNWSAIDVSIFGTLFERGLDPAKRSQLGAHYTDPATIERLIAPVLRRPLLQEWAQTADAIRTQMAKSTRRQDKAHREAQRHFIAWLDRLHAYRALDPACGSGNFLYLALKALKDVEHQSHLQATDLGLDRESDLVTGPHNVLGIELNEYAAELARVTVWIGELQWRLAHGYPFKTNPVLEPLDHIECRDALLGYPVPDAVTAPVAVIASNARQTMSLTARPEPGPQVAQTPGAHEPSAPKSPPTSAPPTPLSDRAQQVSGSDHDFAERNSGSDPDTGPSPTAANLTEAAHPALGAVIASEARQSMTGQRQPATPTEAPVLHPLPLAECLPPARSGGWGEGQPQPVEAPWPRADVVIGNPPFLGDKKMRAELGDATTTALRKTYAGRVPGGADLVCYWFDKARMQIEAGLLQRAGLVATNSIRGGANRKVLDAICAQTRIFEAWSDEPWVNDGAAVRVSLVVFGASEQAAQLDGNSVAAIHADLTNRNTDIETADMTKAAAMSQNALTAFNGIQKTGPFDVPGRDAREWLLLPTNPNGRKNAEVLKPYWNGLDVTRRQRDMWVIDFGWEMPQQDAALFEAPFTYAIREIKPVREINSVEALRRDWWRLWRPRPEMRRRTDNLARFISTPEVAKHRVFSWVTPPILADKNLIVVARADDTTFGILHSRFHELWSLRMGTSLEDRPRYTPTTCFETFPFPPGLTPLDTAHQRTETLDGGACIPADLPVDVPTRLPTENSKQNSTQPSVARSFSAINPGSIRAHASAIAQAAHRLNTLREAWLNPPEWTERLPEVVPLGMDHSPYPDRIVARPGFEKELAKRTLTNLYNQRPAWLAQAHAQLDTAVAAAYGWTDWRADWTDDDILRRLLALNLARHGER